MKPPPARRLTAAEHKSLTELVNWMSVPYGEPPNGQPGDDYPVVAIEKRADTWVVWMHSIEWSSSRHHRPGRATLSCPAYLVRDRDDAERETGEGEVAHMNLNRLFSGEVRFPPVTVWRACTRTDEPLTWYVQDAEVGAIGYGPTLDQAFAGWHARYTDTLATMEGR